MCKPKRQYMLINENNVGKCRFHKCNLIKQKGQWSISWNAHASMQPYFPQKKKSMQPYGWQLLVLHIYIKKVLYKND